MAKEVSQATVVSMKFRPRVIQQESGAARCPRQPADIHPLEDSATHLLEFDHHGGEITNGSRTYIEGHDETAGDAEGEVKEVTYLGEWTVAEHKDAIKKKYWPKATQPSDGIPTGGDVFSDYVTNITEQSEVDGDSEHSSSERERTGLWVMTGDEYVPHILKLHKGMEKAWAMDDKVQALKLVIQAAKLLGDTRFPRIYPVLYLLVTDLLQTFGALVFSRIKTKAEESRDSLGESSFSASLATLNSENAPSRNEYRRGSAQQPRAAPNPAIKLSETFEYADVPLEARETCRNWFLKTSCIRELLPRILVEIALLPCYRFLAETGLVKGILARLASQIRGVGNPLTAVYTQCYLASTGCSLREAGALRGGMGGSSGDEGGHAVQMTADFLFAFQELNSGKVEDLLRQNDLSIPGYVNLMAPAIGVLMECCALEDSTDDSFMRLYSLYVQHCRCDIVLALLIRSYPPLYASKHAVEILSLISDAHTNHAQKPKEGESLINSSYNGGDNHANDSGVTPVPMIETGALEALGIQIGKWPPHQDYWGTLMLEVWRTLDRVAIVSSHSFLRVSVSWAHLISKCGTQKDVSLLLEAAEAQMATAGTGETANFAKLVSSLVDDFPRHQLALSSTHGPGCALSKPQDHASSVVATSAAVILVTAAGKCTAGPQPLLLEAARNMLSTVGALVHGAKRNLCKLSREQLATIIARMISAVQYSPCYGAMLNPKDTIAFYTEMRRLCGYLPNIAERLVSAVLHMCCAGMTSFESAEEEQRTVKACLAFANVTVPAVGSHSTRLHLLRLCASIAAHHECIWYAESFYSMIMVDIPKLTDLLPESVLVSLIQSTMASLAVAKGLNHPILGPIHVIASMMSMIRGLRLSNLSMISVYMSSLRMLASIAYPPLPFNGHTEVVAELSSEAIQQLDEHIGNLDTDSEGHSLCLSAKMDLLNTLTDVLDRTSESSIQMITPLLRAAATEAKSNPPTDLSPYATYTAYRGLQAFRSGARKQSLAKMNMSSTQ